MSHAEMKTDKELISIIALGMVPAVGDINAKKLIKYLGSASAVFKEPYNNLIRIPGIGKTIASHLSSSEYLEKASTELEYIRNHDIIAKCYDEDDYPARLKECPDSPIVLYFKGNANLNAKKILSIVGTRNITRRGKDICRNIINNLAIEYPDLIVTSGLAYGVDITAHKSALKENLKTVAVLGHGFRTIYPSAHLAVAREILSSGALITDFPSYETPERNNFLKRNRIIAGISDATLVIESGRKGGAMVTADIAMSYNRDVMTVPGSPGERYSEGCNMLIKSNRAALIESADDIMYNLNWIKSKTENRQGKLFPENLSPLEIKIFDLFQENDELSSDHISSYLNMPQHQLSSALLKLEFSGLITSIPGNIFRKNI
ncbi:MAG TPA: DNA-protecting protein DprA [Bacteroidales bacterium]|nr:DNA-protecting protein DprA [Bacteroidales bacterium]